RRRLRDRAGEGERRAARRARQRETRGARRGGDGERQVRHPADGRGEPVGPDRGAAMTPLVWVCAAALVVAGVMVLRARRTGADGGDAIRLVTSRYLGGKRFLTIVEVDGEPLLLGLAGAQVPLVTRLKGEGP